MADRVEVLSWDYREQPDLAHLADVVRRMSADTVHLHQVEDTGGQEYALVVSPVGLDEEAVADVYRRWYVSDQPDGIEAPTGD